MYYEDRMVGRLAVPSKTTQGRLVPHLNLCNGCQVLPDRSAKCCDACISAAMPRIMGRMVHGRRVGNHCQG